MNTEGPKKHSVRIAGHPTSLSLEDEFWEELRAIARTRGISLAALLGKIDAARGARSLSSAARVFVLETLKARPGKGARRP